MKSEHKPIRVAHIIGKMCAGGVESVVFNYYRNIDRNKYQFDFYYDSDSAVEPPKELTELGARFYKIPPYQDFLSYMYSLVLLFKKKKYKIVHSNMNTLSVFPLCAAWIAGVPVRINHNHSTAGFGETKKNIFKYALRPFAKIFATHYAACSRYAAEWLFGKKTLKQGKVTIFNNAIDVDRFTFDPVIREDVRKELGIKNKFVVGHVGRFCYQKNHEFLIEVFKRVHDKDENSVLLLAGIGELQDDIKKKVSLFGLEDSVIFLGARNDIERIYQAMDVFVLPSRYEGLPVVGIEAQTAGLPCIFSDKMTNDTVIIKDAHMMPLEKGVQKWAKSVLKCRGVMRKDTSEDIRKAGFDISHEAKKLEIFYDGLLKDTVQNAGISSEISRRRRK